MHFVTQHMPNAPPGLYPTCNQSKRPHKHSRTLINMTQLGRRCRLPTGNTQRDNTTSQGSRQAKGGLARRSMCLTADEPHQPHPTQCLLRNMTKCNSGGMAGACM